MTEPTRLFAERQPDPDQPDVTPLFVSAARAVAAICATRILLLICVVTGCAIWSYVCVDPTRDRLYAAVAFSIVFVVPQVALFWRRG